MGQGSDDDTTKILQANDGDDYEISRMHWRMAGMGIVYVGSRCFDHTEVAIKWILGGSAGSPAKHQELQCQIDRISSNATE